MFVVGITRSNSTPAMVESSGIVSLEMMKIGTAAEKQLINDDDQSRNIKSTGKCPQLVNETNDVKSSFVVDESSEENLTNNSSRAAHLTSNLGDRRFSSPCPYASKIPKFGNSSNYVCSQESKNSALSNVLDNSSSLTSFPLKQSFGLLEKKTASNFELAKQCHDKDDSNTSEKLTSYGTHFF